MKHFVLLTLALLLKTGFVFGSYDINRVMLELEGREKSMEAIQFDFKQEIHFTQMDSDSVITGEALFGKNGRMRIAKETPDKQVTVSDGKKMWVFNPAAKQVWEGSSKKWLESPILPKGMVPLNNYVSDLRKNFNLSLVPEAKLAEGLIKILAEPKVQGSGYKIELIVATNTWLPVQTIYHSESANVITTLSKHLVNPVIQNSAFRFTAPKGTDVIPFN